MDDSERVLLLKAHIADLKLQVEDLAQQLARSHVNMTQMFEVIKGLQVIVGDRH